MNFAAVTEMMTKAVSQGIFPGGVLCAGYRGTLVYHAAFGCADIYKQIPVTTETIFDLASLTKPLATAPAVMKLSAIGKLSVSDRLGDLVPAFAGTDKHRITVAQLLCHCSGMPAHRPFFSELSRLPTNERRTALIESLAATKLEYEPGGTVLYSDLGYMLLRCVVEAVAGLRLDRFINANVYTPLGIKGLFFVPLHDGGDPVGDNVRNRFAATEDCPRRGFLLKGAVHDDNAYESGGVDGHAGLFGTAENVHHIMMELLAIYRKASYDNIFTHNAVQRMLEPQLGTGRTFGFDTPDTEASSAGTRFSVHTIGHLGFTGTSVWMDVTREIIVVLLTNRVHPDRKNEAIKTFRPVLHDAVMDAVAGG
ncbi:MAG: serine hydrolase [Thermodesulfobacteriota bacterium]|nr:serine hydrolase [Thermodesulfobacteriota bacterium]